MANNGDENKVPQEDGNEEERMESSITEEDEDKMSLKMDTSKRRKKLGKRSMPVNVLYSYIVCCLFLYTIKYQYHHGSINPFNTDACTIDPSINGNGDGDELIPLLDTANQRHQHCKNGGLILSLYM